MTSKVEKKTTATKKAVQEDMQGKSKKATLKKGLSKKLKSKKLKLSKAKKANQLRSSKGIKYILDCKLPLKDSILEIHDLEKFFKDNIKVENKTNNLKNKISVTSDDTKIYITVHIPFSKRYIKYLTKKYLKMHQIRDFLRVTATSKQVYELKYFQVPS